MTARIEVGFRPELLDPRGLATLSTIRSFLGISPRQVRTFDVFLLDLDLSPQETFAARLLFTDPVSQLSSLGRLTPPACDYVVQVGFRPGVTDAVGKSALAALRDRLGRDFPPGSAVYTSKIYFIDGVTSGEAHAIASGLLANPVIERSSVQLINDYLKSPVDESVPAVRSRHSPRVQSISLEGAEEELDLLSQSRLWALRMAELQAIQKAFSEPSFIEKRKSLGLGKDPTDVEMECIAQTWSEHCKHKIFNAHIHYEEPNLPPRTYQSLFHQHIRTPTEQIRAQHIADTGQSWLISVFDDNAGVVAFTDRYHLVYKVETHNSPSALDPYGGAMTGIVGVNRDTFGTGLGSELLVNVWGYCFADPRYQGSIPQGLLHPRRIRDGVHRGVIEGGNQSGIPYGRGWELFDDRYLGKPLVYCGTLGRMPVQTAGRPTHHKEVHPGDRIVMCGGRIGKDGIHGATFSSTQLDESSPVQAVQIGDPITQKKMFDFLLEARDLGLYRAMTDNGAGGLSSSVGELCQLSGGAQMDLSLAPLKYAGLDPWEVLVSEAQERMTLAVPPEHMQTLLELAQRREVDTTDLGMFTDSGHFHLLWNRSTIGWIPLDFLHHGLPELHIPARWVPPHHPEPRIPEQPDWNATLLGLLGSPNIASKENRYRQYDHGVKGLTVVGPFVGKKADVPADAAVFLVEHGRWEGVVLSEGVNPFYSDIDTRWMTASVIDEAVRKAVGTGAKLERMAALDNYCWPDPVESPHTPDGAYKAAQLVRSTQALSEFCLAYGVPCVSGKDSMKNDSRLGGVKISIPPTLLISVFAPIWDVTQAITLDAKTPGAQVYLLGITRHELGASELYRFWKCGPGNDVPTVDPQETLPLYRAVTEAIEKGLIQSCHSPTLGGLGIALAKVAMGGELGLNIDLDCDKWLEKLSSQAALFSESNGRFLVTVSASKAQAFEECMGAVSWAKIGVVTQEPVLEVRRTGTLVLSAPIDALKAAWKESFDGR